MAFRQRKAGRQAEGHRPSESELLSLGAAWAMVMRHCGGNWTSNHAELVADEVKRAGGSTQLWTNDEVRTDPHLPLCSSATVPVLICQHVRAFPQIYNFVKEPAMKYMRTSDITKWIQKEQSDPETDPTEKTDLDFCFVQSVVFSLLLQKTNSKCASENSVRPLLNAAKLNSILGNALLGGQDAWTLDLLLSVPDDESGARVKLWEVHTQAEINQTVLNWLRDIKARPLALHSPAACRLRTRLPAPARCRPSARHAAMHPPTKLALALHLR